MKKLLIQLDTDKRASTFDQVVAYDAGADNIISHADIKKEEVEDIIYGAVFTRSPKKMNNTAVFIGGSDVNKGEEILAAVKDVFFANFRVSVLLDSNGANTTAAAAVLKIKNSVNLKDKKAVVIAGTGPVGVRAAMLLAREGAEVVITSRSRERAEKKAEEIMEKYDVKNISGVQGSKKEEFEKIISGKDVILSAGPPKINFLTEDMWKKVDSIKVMGDINAVSPAGIEGIKPGADGDIIDGVKVFGALGIGGLKMKLHKKAVAELFKSTDSIFNAVEVYKLYKELN
ncbi:MULTISPECIES: NAD(P)-dependent methylenetetrahydromethanopterin dehydrogenase [unclassified Halanaerobium]|uniref:NAD(P)-dependent methylenetetrahydromethanopterin dehydrogenase n=1 Tax=unclassified Halanaerobium TaxID=2641197 RepID=UPI000DF31543|nr:MULTISPECIES: NAD(P)-dependent methylenetetrahydromethanopterin dehydrogenase [unclassified Halanaerobium]RCW48747.1 5,10-methylenetetrahydrofolate dehydrogenase (NADP+) [Halanaerobium sp. MA284_MarDTE_T2]RCW89089.1 5,10-methylenetetrahydrofolate dehydrogenase (NADP+) [Halanaerobium sp. DL-01]